MTSKIEQLPNLGDLVWCYFPEIMGNSWPKPRPALVVGVSKKHHQISVAFGTSKKTSKLYPTEILISKNDGEDIFAISGLSYDTKFDFAKLSILPFTSEYFARAPKKNNIPYPKLGTVHISHYPAMRKAIDAVNK